MRTEPVLSLLIHSLMNTLLSFGKRPAAAAPLLALLFFTASCSRFNASGGLSI